MSCKALGRPLAPCNYKVISYFCHYFVSMFEGPHHYRSIGEEVKVYYSDLNLQADIPLDSVYPIGTSFDESASLL